MTRVKSETLICATVALLATLAFATSASASSITFLASCDVTGGTETKHCDGTSYPTQVQNVDFQFGEHNAAFADATINMRAELGDTGLYLVAIGGAYDQFFARTLTHANIAYFDTQTVTSSTLAPGTPVIINVAHLAAFEYSLSESLAGPSSSVLTRWRFFSHLQVFGGNGFLDNMSYRDQAPGTFGFLNTGQIITTVGSTISISYLMDAEMNLFVEQPSMNIPEGTSATATLDAFHSGHAFLDVVTPGASLVGDSGHDYRTPVATAVPEPASLALLTMGLAAALGARRRFAQ